jgi:hypothetical protein
LIRNRILLRQQLEFIKKANYLDSLDKLELMKAISMHAHTIQNFCLRYVHIIQFMQFSLRYVYNIRFAKWLLGDAANIDTQKGYSVEDIEGFADGEYDTITKSSNYMILRSHSYQVFCHNNSI